MFVYIMQQIEDSDNVDTEQMSSLLSRAKIYLARIRSIHQKEAVIIILQII